MAYKYHIGTLKSAGDIDVAEIKNSDVDDATAANIVAEIDNGEIPIAKLSAKTISGKDLGGNLDQLSVANQKGLSMSAYNGSAAVADLQVVLDGAGAMEFNGASGIRIKADGIKDTMIDFGTGGGQISSADIPEQTNLYYTDARVTTRIAAAASAAAVRGHFTGGVGVDLSAGGDITLDLAELPAAGFSVSDAKIPWIDNADASKHAVWDDIIGFTAGGALKSSGGVMAVDFAANGGLEAPSGANLRLDIGGLAGTMTDNVVVGGDFLVIHDVSEAGAQKTKKITMEEFAQKLAAGSGLTPNAAGHMLLDDAYARGLVSAVDAGGDGSFAYNSSNGQFTYTGPSAAEVQAHLSVADSNSIDMSYSGGAFSAAVLPHADSLELHASGLRLKDSISGNRTFSGNVVISGDLQVDGTSVVLNTTTLEVEDKNIYMAKGNANSAGANGAGLTIEMGANDLTFAWDHTSQAMELKLGAGFSADIKARKFIGDLQGAVSQTVNVIGDAAATLVKGFNSGNTSFTAPREWTLPADPSIGDVVMVKAPANAEAQNLTIAKGAVGQSIDGVASAVLQSDDAALSFIATTAGNTAKWRAY